MSRFSSWDARSTKSMHGHTIGAAGGIEAIVCIKAIETGTVPPTINSSQPRQPFHHSAKMLLLLAPASTGLAARAAVGRAAVGRHQPLRMMASECPRLPEPEQSEQSQTATFAMG